MCGPDSGLWGYGLGFFSLFDKRDCAMEMSKFEKNLIRYSGLTKRMGMLARVFHSFGGILAMWVRAIEKSLKFNSSNAKFRFLWEEVKMPRVNHSLSKLRYWLSVAE